MTKRLVAWSAVLGLLLVAGLCALVLGRVVKRELHRTLLASASASVLEAPEPAQAIVPRAADFLLPQRLDAWRIIGPGGGGAFYHPTISPFDPNLVFATTDMSGCFVSENGGHTWRTINFRTSCEIFFDPKLPNRVYALARAIWRSDDRGHTWSMLYPNAAAKPGYVDDEAEYYLLVQGSYPYGIAAMALDPDDGNILYANEEERLQVSRDAGKTWKVIPTDPVRVNHIWVDPTSSRERRVVYTHTSNVIGTWDGVTYIKRPIPGVGDVYGVAFGTRSGGGKPVLYATADYANKGGHLYGGVMASDDGGVTWRSLNDGILKLVAKDTYPEFTMLGTSRNHAEVLYASYLHMNLANDERRYLGVLKTTDGGATWAAVRQEGGVTAANMHNDWTSSRFGPDFGEQPLAIGVDDNNPDLVYTGDLARVMRSADGGKNWSGVFSQSTGKGYTTTGLDNTTCYGIHFDPFDPKRMFISYTDIGLMRSEDGGESWLSATSKGVPVAWKGNTYWVEFDPAVKGKMWAVMTNHHDLPRMRELRRNGVGGVLVSVDGGESWTVSSRGLSEATVATHILLDPKSPSTARVLYITAFGNGVFKSTDGGKSWTAKNSGLPEKPPIWRMAMDSEGTLYAVTIRRSQTGKYGDDQDGFLFRSRDGAESWERVPLPAGVNGPVGIAVDPRDPARLYVAAWGRYVLYATGVPPVDGGVYMSADSGRHWQNVLNASQHMYDVTVDPRNSELVYAAGFESSAWRSVDRGKTWSRIRGFNFSGGHRVIPDPVDIDKIYITTMGNSVWHGPAAGDPNATEDLIAPPGMRFTPGGK